MNPLSPGGKPGEPVSCSSCGQSYPQDPPFEVTCPDCGATPGTYCKRPSGHQGPFNDFHTSRDLKANAEGFYGHSCSPINQVAEVCDFGLFAETEP